VEIECEQAYYILKTHLQIQLHNAYQSPRYTHVFGKHIHQETKMSHKVTQGRRTWYCLTGHLSLSISAMQQQRLYLAPFKILPSFFHSARNCLSHLEAFIFDITVTLTSSWFM